MLKKFNAYPFAPHRMTYSQISFDRYHREDEYGGCVTHSVNEMIHPTEEIAKYPSLHEIERYILINAKQANAEISYREVHKEEICCGSYSTIQAYHHDHKQVACNGTRLKHYIRNLMYLMLVVRYNSSESHDSSPSVATHVHSLRAAFQPRRSRLRTQFSAVR